MDTIDECTFEVNGANHSIFGGAEREIDDGNRMRLRFQRRMVRAVRAVWRAFGRITSIRAAGDDFDGRQQIGEGANRRALGGAAMACDQNAADSWIDDTKQHGEFEIVLSDDGRERESLLQIAPEDGGW